MVGMESPDPGSDKALDLIRSGPDVFLGDARITIDDLTAPDVDVSFTNIYNVTEGTPHDEMSWEHLRVQDGGLFGGLTGRRDGNEYLAGMFTGPGIRKWVANSGETESWEPSARNANSSGTEHFGRWRLRVRLGAATAGFCLDPPRGRVTLAFATPSDFVALPSLVKRIDWRDICAPASAPSGKAVRDRESYGQRSPRALNSGTLQQV